MKFKFQKTAASVIEDAGNAIRISPSGFEHTRIDLGDKYVLLVNEICFENPEKARLDKETCDLIGTNPEKFCEKILGQDTKSYSVIYLPRPLYWISKADSTEIKATEDDIRLIIEWLKIYGELLHYRFDIEAYDVSR